MQIAHSFLYIHLFKFFIQCIYLFTFIIISSHALFKKYYLDSNINAGDIAVQSVLTVIVLRSISAVQRLLLWPSKLLYRTKCFIIKTAATFPLWVLYIIFKAVFFSSTSFLKGKLHLTARLLVHWHRFLH